MGENKSNAWQEWKKSLGDVRPWDVVDPRTQMISKEKSDVRYKICLECPELIKATKQCKKCGCFMQLKTKLPNAECPIGKWGKEDTV